MTIPYGRQEITAADIKAVVEVLQSDYLTQGPLCALLTDDQQIEVVQKLMTPLGHQTIF